MRKSSFCSWMLAFLIFSPVTMVLSAAEPTGPAAGSLKAWRRPAVERQRRIIYDNDGNEATFIITRPDRQDFLDARTTAVAGTHVDSIFYCANAGVGFSTRGSKVWRIHDYNAEPHTHNQTAPLLERGLDPLRMIVEFCREQNIEVFTSIRMNDTHDGAVDGYGRLRYLENPFKMAHPDWLLGSLESRPRHGSHAAVNYSVPEVRDFVFAFIEEAIRNYDLDGVHLDFFRHPVFFPTTARGDRTTDAERDAMTEIMQRTRRLADEVGQQRGRPILVSIRVPDSAEYCHDIGLDIRRWMQDDLIDLLVGASYFQLNRWEATAKLAHEYGVKFYPSLDENRLPDQEANSARRTLAAYRGRAANVWQSGADGLLLFNSFNPKSPLWRELGDWKTLQTLDRTYFPSIRGARRAAGGNLPYDNYLKIETLNPEAPLTLTQSADTRATLQIGEDFSQSNPASILLRIRLSQSVSPEQLLVSVNNHKLTGGQAAGNWVEFPAPAAAFVPGANGVTLQLATQGSPDVLWEDLQLVVQQK